MPRNAPPLFNLFGVDTLFWDGRVHQNANNTLQTPAGGDLPDGLDSALAAQAMFPVTSRTEMRGDSGDTTVMSEVNERALIADNDLPAQWDALMTRLLNIPGYVALSQSDYPGVATNELGFEHAANAIAAYETDQLASRHSAREKVFLVCCFEPQESPYCHSGKFFRPTLIQLKIKSGLPKQVVRSKPEVLFRKATIP